MAKTVTYNIAITLTVDDNASEKEIQTELNNMMEETPSYFFAYNVPSVDIIHTSSVVSHISTK